MVLGTVAGVTIVLERLDGNKWTGLPERPDTVRTAPIHSRCRVTPGDVPPDEIGLDPKVWYIYSPAGGVITGVVPGATNQDFMNQRSPRTGS